MFKLKPADPAATLATFRKMMKENGVDAYIVPSEDPHMSEYPPECCARRVYISNFTGSAGTAVITADKALLWTDGRYGHLASRCCPRIAVQTQDHPLLPCGQPCLADASSIKHATQHVMKRMYAWFAYWIRMVASVVPRTARVSGMEPSVLLTAS